MAYSRQSLLERALLCLWFGKSPWLWLLRLPLLPFSFVFQALAWVNRCRQKKRAVQLPVPVIVVGNITVGGTGKTPFVIALVNELIAQDIKVGVVSRGYRSCAPSYPYRVKANDTADITGDEPLLIARSTQAPIVIGKKRVLAAQYLLQQCPDLDMIVSDDGLQHYQLQRDVEIILVDGQRGLGNHLLLPAGPLREPAHRLASADWIFTNRLLTEEGSDYLSPSKLQPVNLQAQGWLHLQTQKTYPLEPLPWDSTLSVNAITGIGNPKRFFASLQDLGVEASCYAYDDHYTFTPKDFVEKHSQVVLMTEKDAIKCQHFAKENWWALQITMTLPSHFLNHIKALRSA